MSLYGDRAAIERETIPAIWEIVRRVTDHHESILIPITAGHGNFKG